MKIFPSFHIANHTDVLYYFSAMRTYGTLYKISSAYSA